ncbi:MAG: hypothetical protein JSR18_10585 [Proteobacteria bacterium]|nr:hypothetical protein [Pseudomonadota bacterium]
MSPGTVCAVLVAVAASALPAAASAFVFTDGKAQSCIVRGVALREYAAPATDPTVKDRVGVTLPENGSYVIVWNPDRLKALPPPVHDFIFFHECAHAQLPTSVELQANCAGLKAMRAAGRAGPAVEAELEAFFKNSGYWQDTLRCANRVVEPTPEGMLKLAPPPASKPAG